MARAAALTSMRTRRRLAAGLEGVVLNAKRQRPSLSSQAPVAVAEVRTSASTLLLLAELLRSDQPVRPKGVAMIESLLSDSCSPLYRPTFTGALREIGREAYWAMQPEANGTFTTQAG